MFVIEGGGDGGEEGGGEEDGGDGMGLWGCEVMRSWDK